ncbi:hypothetical protein DMH17_10700 [Raoultella planticola]|nr:hypothetical protein [Raoultella planticola]
MLFTGLLFTNGFFCSLRHHPFIKQVHSLALITILGETKGLLVFYVSPSVKKSIRKRNFAITPHNNM